MEAVVDNVSACVVRIVQKLLTLVADVSGRQSQASPSPNFPTQDRLCTSVDLQEICEGRDTNPTFNVPLQCSNNATSHREKVVFLAVFGGVLIGEL